MNAGVLTTVPDKKEAKKLSLKFQKWCKLFTDPKSESYGNGTKSALVAYKCKNYHVASQIGYENMRKLEFLGLAISENEGLDVREWFKIAAAKAVKGSYEQTINFMERIGILTSPTVAAANQNNFQFNFADLAASFTQSRKERGLPTEEAHSNLKDELKK